MANHLFDLVGSSRLQYGAYYEEPTKGIKPSNMFICGQEAWLAGASAINSASLEFKSGYAMEALDCRDMLIAFRNAAAGFPNLYHRRPRS